MTIQRYSFGTQKPDRDECGEFVKFADIEGMLAAARKVVDSGEYVKFADIRAIDRLLSLAAVHGEDVNFEERDGAWTLSAGQLGFGEGNSPRDAATDWERRFPAGKTTDAQRAELLKHERPDGPLWNNQ